MGVKFKSPLELSGHRAIAHTDVAQTLVVKVVTKTNAHPEYGSGSSNGYTIDGVEGAYLEFTPGNTYKFDQSDSSNATHPLRFYEDAAKTTAYTTGVTTSGTPGSSGAYTQIIPTVSTPPILFYQCSAHALMGSYVKFGTGSQGDTYTLSATQDGNNVDVLLDAGTGTDSTLQLTAGNNITLTRNNAQEVTIAASGGGGGTVTVQKNVYTANGSTTAFNTTSAIANENNVQVYLDGVYQSKDNYTTNASTVTMATAPANGTSVELIHMVAVDGVIARDSFTGNGSTTAYVLSMSISNENATQVYLDGVYQSKDNYSTSGSTLTFSTAPPNGTAIEVVHIKAVNASSLNQNNFTGDGSTTAFTLSQTIDDEVKTFVFIQGVYQEKSTYSISGTTLTFTTAPQNGYTVEVMAFSTISIGNAVTGATEWQSTVKNSNFTAAAGKGYFVNTTSGEITVNLPAGSVGDEIHFTDYTSNFDTNAIRFDANGTQKILNSTDDKKCTTKDAIVRLVYQDDTKGWTGENLGDISTELQLLLVAGGGASLKSAGCGGGGAGGVLEGTLNINPGTTIGVTIGAGGSSDTGSYPSNGSSAQQGSNTVFTIDPNGSPTAYTALGGGKGGGYTVAGANGGSGGGGGGSIANSTNTAAGTSSQSNVTHSFGSLTAHGTSGGVNNSNGYDGGGGGGAGSAGGNSSFTGGSTWHYGHGGDGGNGLVNTILSTSEASNNSVGEVVGTSVYFAGGGGGGTEGTQSTSQGTGGHGGGGNGFASNTVYTNANSGGQNTGGGAGGSGVLSTQNSAPGGSGVAIIKIVGGAGSTFTNTGSPVLFDKGSDKIAIFKGTGTIIV